MCQLSLIWTSIFLSFKRHLTGILAHTSKVPLLNEMNPVILSLLYNVCGRIVLIPLCKDDFMSLYCKQRFNSSFNLELQARHQKHLISLVSSPNYIKLRLPLGICRHEVHKEPQRANKIPKIVSRSICLSFQINSI